MKSSFIFLFVILKKNILSTRSVRVRSISHKTRGNMISTDETESIWCDLGVNDPNELRPDRTLIMGQCFNWRKLPITESTSLGDEIFIGVIDDKAIGIKYYNDRTYFACLGVKYTPELYQTTKEYLHHYFQLNYSLSSLYTEWSLGCTRMNTIVQYIKGVRVVKQDPWECLISFICSSNNNIKRITLMLDRLRYKYGDYICTILPSTASTTATTTSSTSSNNNEALHMNMNLHQNNMNFHPNWKVIIDPTMIKPITNTYDRNSTNDNNNDNNNSTYLSSGRNTQEVLKHIQSPSKKPSNKSMTKNNKRSHKDLVETHDDSDTDDSDNNNMNINENYSTNQPLNSHIHVDDTTNNITTDMNTTNNSKYHLFTFPSIDTIANADEASLRELGMGYRAKFIIKTAQKIQSFGGKSWLQNLELLGLQDFLVSSTSNDKCNIENTSENVKNQVDETVVKDMELFYEQLYTSQKKKSIIKGNSTKKKKKNDKSNTTDNSNSNSNSRSDSNSNSNETEIIKKEILEDREINISNRMNSRLYVQNQLTLLPGVGRKVADCVALFSLHQAGSVPVDTHVWDIAVRDYDSSLIQYKSLTPTVYELVGDIFRTKFGSKAGWAHSVLFAGELPEFRMLLPVELQEEMKLYAKSLMLSNIDKKRKKNMEKSEKEER